MSRGQQPSILSFFQRAQPHCSAPSGRSSAPASPTSPASPASPSTPPAGPPSGTENGNTASEACGVSVPTEPRRTSADLPMTGLSPSKLLPPPSSLPAEASIVPMAESHVAALRRINSLLLPIHYPDAFYKKLVDPDATQRVFSRAILWQDDAACAPKVVGGLVCRLEPYAFLDEAGHRQPLPQAQALDEPVRGAGSTSQQVYIQSLALLSPYRARGLAASALDHMLASAAAMGRHEGGGRIQTVYAHVWTQNEAGLRWYRQRGFTCEGDEPVKGYYFKLRPDTAWIMRRDVGGPRASNGLGITAGPATGHATPPPPDSTVAATVDVPAGRPAPSRPALPPSGLSYQNLRPESEWNDLPAEMVSANGPGRSHLSPPTTSSAPASGTSSRSSSTARKKRDRAYPAEAFGV